MPENNSKKFLHLSYVWCKLCLVVSTSNTTTQQRNTMRKMLRRWLGIDDLMSVTDALDARYQSLHGRISKLEQLVSMQEDMFVVQEKLNLAFFARLTTLQSQTDSKLSKDEFEGVNEEFRKLEDEFCEFRVRSFSEIKEVRNCINAIIESHNKVVNKHNILVGHGQRICDLALENSSKIRFLSKFIGAVAKQKEEVK